MLFVQVAMKIKKKNSRFERLIGRTEADKRKMQRAKRRNEEINIVEGKEKRTKWQREVNSFDGKRSEQRSSLLHERGFHPF